MTKRAKVNFYDERFLGERAIHGKRLSETISRCFQFREQNINHAFRSYKFSQI